MNKDNKNDYINERATMRKNTVRINTRRGRLRLRIMITGINGMGQRYSITQTKDDSPQRDRREKRN